MKLRTLLATCVFLTLASPALVFAQDAPSNGAPFSGMQQARDDAKTAAMNDLSPDHRTAVDAIVQKFDAGSVSMSDAAGQIDALLTPQENTAVLGEAQKFREAMRQAFASNGGPQGGPGGPPGGGDHGTHHRQPDAGRFLLMVSASRDALQRDRPGPP